MTESSSKRYLEDQNGLLSQNSNSEISLTALRISSYSIAVYCVSAHPSVDLVGGGDQWLPLSHTGLGIGTVGKSREQRRSPSSRTYHTRTTYKQHPKEVQHHIK